MFTKLTLGLGLYAHSDKCFSILARKTSFNSVGQQNLFAQNEHLFMTPLSSSNTDGGTEIVASKNQKLNNYKGFTLIELLVVIAIIAILSSLGFSSYSKAKASTRRVSCINNERQLGLLTLHYVDDNGYFPAHSSSTSDWKSEIDPKSIYGRTILKCPEERLGSNESSSNPPVREVSGGFRPKPKPGERFVRRSSYIMNGFVDAFVDNSGKVKETIDNRMKSEYFEHPVSTILFGENSIDSKHSIIQILPADGRYLSDLNESRHGSGGSSSGSKSGGSNYLFADGHAEFIHFGKSTCPVNQWAVTSYWRSYAALCQPR